MINKMVGMIMFLLLAAGCDANTLELGIHFDRIRGLKDGNPVVFQDNRIGSVSGVTYTKDGDFRVAVEIGKDFAPAVTEHSRFFIVPDYRDGLAAVRMIRVQENGKPLASGAEIEGTTPYAANIDRFWNDFEKGVDDLSGNLRALADELKGIAESDNMKNLEQELERLKEELQESGGELRQKFRQDILPKITKEVEELRKRLEALGREKELEPIQRELDEIRRI